MATIRITVDGKPALTVEQAAERYGVKPASMRGELTRAGLTASPDAKLDGRKPLYLVTRLDKLMKDRPGKGSPGQARPDRALAALRKREGSAPTDPAAG